MEIEVLENKLQEKDMELKYLKKELKEWWHDDVKSPKTVQFSENLISKEQSYQALPMASPEKARNPVMSQSKSSGKSIGVVSTTKQQQTLHGKKKSLLNGPDNESIKDLHLGSAEYLNSLKILEKLKEDENSKKKLEPLRRDKGDGNRGERPSSVNQKKKPSNDKFKLRFSNALGQGALKINARYKPQEAEVIEESAEVEKEEHENKEADNDFKLKNYSNQQSNRQFVKNRYEVNDEEEENTDDEIPESPVIVLTSKTLVLQSRIMTSKDHNPLAMHQEDYFHDEDE